MSERGEQSLVQQLVTQPAVEALDEGVLRRLAWRGRCQSKILNTWSCHRTAQIDPEKCRKINGYEIRF
jgi:hypothetical protein